MIYCSHCQTPNPEGNVFCQQCRTPLTRQYLWAVGSGDTVLPGTVLGDRYLCKQGRIFLDTQPGVLAVNPGDLPLEFLSYLRLSPWQLHVPQVYDWLVLEPSQAPIIFLDKAPLYATRPEADRADSGELQIQLFPPLLTLWPQANALRQLNWLWQMAQLWQPLSSEQRARSLLIPDGLRVEGALVRLLELAEAEAGTPPSLVDLGHLWQQWTAHPDIDAWLQELTQQLIQQAIYNVEQLVDALDGAIAQLSKTQTRHVHFATRTDQGPTRQRNEDACYPASGTVTSQALDAPAEPLLVVVCDGIGGHQGGNVASQLAIDTTVERIHRLDLDQLDPTSLTIELEKAACAANDVITERNDSEQRFDRQRMGTTLVMALVQNHELYLTHIGDSRAYRITRWGCHQVTLDDDVASREVRLGYGFYRQALQHPGSGSLVQALGMSASTLLYPNVQRFILDEDCIFLLCSDGLSDNDRIEECWETEILPSLDDTTNLAAVSQRLIEIANTRNGHDNVTIGLITCQVVDQTQTAAPLPARSSSVGRSRPTGSVPSATPSATAKLSERRTQVLPQPRQKSWPRLLLGIFILLGLGTGLAYVFLPILLNRSNPPTVTESPSPVAASPLSLPLKSGDLLQVNLPAALQSAGQFPVLMTRPNPPASPPASPLIAVTPPSSPGQLPSPSVSTSPSLSPSLSLSPSPSLTPSPLAPVPQGSIPSGSILKVVKRQENSQGDRWVQLRVCSTPASVRPDLSRQPNGGVWPSTLPSVLPSGISSGASPPVSSLSPSPSPLPWLERGAEGWIQEDRLLPLVGPSTISPGQQEACTEAG